MRRTWMALLLLVALAAVLSIADAPQTRAGGQVEATGQTEAEQATVEVPLVIPAAEKARKNPLRPTDENLERGYQLYSSQCAMCHGARGAGDGDLAGSLKIKMPDWTSAAEQRKRTDGELFHILTAGHGRMPAEGARLSEDFRWSMILAIRSMARDKG